MASRPVLAFTEPLSPADATKVTPGNEVAEKLPSSPVSPNSPPLLPKLIETTVAPPPPLATDFAAQSAAVSKSLSELVFASTRMMFAPGAMACAHSTSRASSSGHPGLLREPLRSRGSFPGSAVPPSSLTTLKVPLVPPFNAGKPLAKLNDIRSLVMVGSLKASMSAMVCPAPLLPAARSELIE